MKRKRAFTLVELLVVISIIALLLSMLMPALNKAREQARLLTDMANCKQVGTIISLYQAEFSGAVPIVFNRWAAGSTGSSVQPLYEVKNAYLSVALRDYSESTKNLKSRSNNLLDPDGTWQHQWTGRLKTYVTNYLPKHFVCPFGRGRSAQPTPVDEGVITLQGSGGSVTYHKYTYKGTFESYSTWTWGRDKDEDLTKEGNHPHPWGAPNGYPKYTSLPWNSTLDDRMQGGHWVPNVTTPIRWGSKRHLNGRGKVFPITSMSDVAITYCFMGENYDWNNYIFNYGSHKRGKFGGTTAIFADNHVEWVKGTQIGWP